MFCTINWGRCYFTKYLYDYDMNSISWREINTRTAAIHLFCTILDSQEWVNKTVYFLLMQRLSGFAQTNIQPCLAGWGWGLIFLNISYCHSETYRRDQLCRISLSYWEQRLSQHARSSTGKIKKCNNHSFFTTVPTPLPCELTVSLSLTARAQGLTQSQPQYFRLWPLRGSDAGLV